ncbi:MAG TPA: hypothetical protein VFW48_11150 [Solirubrobacterales bacterium]|nr:hypothetical protein [Solirubrobacterales bacterium]
MGEIPGSRGFGWVVALALSVSVLGFAASASGQTPGAASSQVIDLCEWEPMSCFEDLATVNVTRNGTGSGTVTSSPAGINCGVFCSGKFPVGSVVTLTAKASEGSKFTGWSGGFTAWPDSGCSGTGTCTIPLAFIRITVFPPPPPPPVGVTATFDLESKPKNLDLTVSKTGTGSGTVKSSPAGIDCGGTCMAEFEEGEEVTLWAGAAAGSVVSSWRGCDVAIGRECRVTVDGAEAVSARFTEVKTLSAQKAGEGAGSVTTSPGGIACPMACSSTSALFPTGRSVAVKAASAKGSVFTGWGGACSGTGACAVTLSESKLVTAEFAPLPKRSLTLNKEGSGAGTVKSLPSTFNCGAPCTSQTASFNQGTVVTLTQTPAKGSVFGGWTGACSGTGACVVTLSEAETVGAAFAPIESKPTGPTRLLTVGKAEGTGTGTVGSNPGGITCYSGCTHQSARFKEGAVVALEATPGRDSTFAEWGGACSGSGSCEVTMSEARSVTAEFTAIPTKTLTVNKAGEGAGGVVGRPSGISCRQNCTTATAFFPRTTAVALTPYHGRFASEYVQWEGCDSFEGVECMVTTLGDKTVTARFD